MICFPIFSNTFAQEDEFVSDRASEMLQFYTEFIVNCIELCYRELMPSASFQRQVRPILRLKACYLFFYIAKS